MTKQTNVLKKIADTFPYFEQVHSQHGGAII